MSDVIIKPISSEFSYDAIREDLNKTRSQSIFHKSTNNVLDSEINFDETIRNLVSENTSRIEEHEVFIINNADNVKRVEKVEATVDEFKDQLERHLIYDNFDGNIDDVESVPSIEEQVYSLKQEVEILKRDYGTALNTADLVFQNQKAQETLKELESIISDMGENIIPIREMVSEVKESRTDLNGEKHNTLNERLQSDLISIRKDVDLLLNKRIELDLLQNCVNTLLMTNTTIIRNSVIEEQEFELVDYLVYQIKNNKMNYSDIVIKYPHLTEVIDSKLE